MKMILIKRIKTKETYYYLDLVLNYLKARTGRKSVEYTTKQI